MKVNSTEGGEENIIETALEIWDKNIPAPLNEIFNYFSINNTYPVRGVIRVLLSKVISGIKLSSHPSGEEAAYWKQRCEAAEELIRLWDQPDFSEFTKARDNWQQFKKEKENPHA